MSPPDGCCAGSQSEQADLLEHHYVGLTDIHPAAGLAALFNTLFVFESYPIDREALREAGSALDGMPVTGVDMRRQHRTTR